MTRRHDLRQFAVVLLAAMLVTAGAAFAGIPDLDGDGEAELSPAVERADAAIPIAALGFLAAAGVAGGAAAYAVSLLENSGEIDTDDAGSQVETDTYSHADTLRKAGADKTTASKNFGKLQEGVLMTEAKLEMLRIYNDGGTESQMALEGKSVINNKTAKLESELVASGNYYLSKIWSLRDAHVNSAAGNDTLYLDNNQGATADLGNGYYFEPGELNSSEWHYELMNGSHKPVAVISEGNISTYGDPTQCSVCASLDWHDSSSWGSSDIWHRTPDGLDSNDFPEVKVWNDADMENQLSNTRSRANSLKDQMGPMAEHIAANFSRGEVDVGNVTSPWERAQALGSHYNETGDDKYLNALLAETGYDSAIDRSFTIKLHNDSKTVEADLFQEAFQTIENGTTYYPTTELQNTGGVPASQQWDPGKASVAISYNPVRSLEQNFTVIGITDADGHELENTSFQSNDWETNNVSTLEDQLDKLAAFQANLTLTNDTALGGGSSGGWFDGLPGLPGLPNELLYGALGLLGAGGVLYARREDLI